MALGIIKRFEQYVNEYEIFGLDFKPEQLVEQLILRIIISVLFLCLNYCLYAIITCVCIYFSELSQILRKTRIDLFLL